MGFLSNAVAQMIATMEPDERREAIETVTKQALDLMDAADRLVLTRNLLVMLVDSLEPDARARLATEVLTGLARGH